MAQEMAAIAPTAQANMRGDSASATRFAVCVLAVAVASLALAGWAPLGFSIVTVFLFAAPHNWTEGRYLISRMPARWGPLCPFFLTGIGGVLVLTAAFAALPWWASARGWNGEQWLIGLAMWNTALVVWILLLARMRAKQNPRRDWAWMVPVGLALIGLNWLSPQAWSLGLVYLHPLIALWFLDRELAQHRPEWRRAYRACLAALPLLLGILWWQLYGAPSLSGNDLLTGQITRHAGAGILSGVSSHLLVSTHTFLEMLHYGVWLVAIPAIAVGVAPWKLTGVPLARKSAAWKGALAGVLVLGAMLTLVFWAGFLANYPATRDIYFTVAMLHVLAEAPFLLRLL